MESLCTAISTKSVFSVTAYGVEAPTLLNQSDISDLVEKSFNSCCWISRAMTVIYLWNTKKDNLCLPANAA